MGAGQFQIRTLPSLDGMTPIDPTSRRCPSAWQPNLGRGSTYRRGKSVQTTGTSSPWRSQPFGFALDIDQALCVRRDPHLSDFPRSDCHYSGDRFNHVGGHFDSAPRAEYSTSREYNI